MLPEVILCWVANIFPGIVATYILNLVAALSLDFSPPLVKGLDEEASRSVRQKECPELLGVLIGDGQHISITS